MDDTITMITGLTATERGKALSWWTGLPEEQRVDILQAAVKQHYQLKESHHELEGRLSRYCGLLLSIRHGGWDTVKGKGYRVAGAEQYRDFSHLREAKAASLIQRGRKPLTRKKILAHWGEIAEMRSHGHGFRLIAEYLQRVRKIKTSAVYLSRLWRETK